MAEHRSKEQAKLQRKREKAERAKRLTDKGEKYQVRFNFADTQGLYEDRAVLPAAALWNMDEFLFAYIAAGLDGLLKGHTDWDSVPGGTRKKLKKARNLARRYVAARDDILADLDTQQAGHDCLILLTQIGVSHLWD